MRNLPGLPRIFGIRLGKFLAGLIFAGFVATSAWSFFMPPMRSFARAHERLPTAVIEDRHTVYCRMQYCDFRFPLPSDSVVETLDKVGGGLDTIDGSLRVATLDGNSFDMRAYIQLLQQHGFRAETADGASFFAQLHEAAWRLHRGVAK